MKTNFQKMSNTQSPNTKKQPTPTCWCYIRLPCRPGLKYVTYDSWSYKLLPPIEIDPRFKNIKTVQDVKENVEFLNSIIRSATGCYFNFEAPNEFYRDQQSCVVWAFDEKIGVYLGGYVRPPVVAVSIPEFLTRINLENIIAYVTRYKYKDIQLTQEAEKYIEFYVDIRRKLLNNGTDDVIDDEYTQQLIADRKQVQDKVLETMTEMFSNWNLFDHNITTCIILPYIAF